MNMVSDLTIDFNNKNVFGKISLAKLAPTHRT